MPRFSANLGFLWSNLPLLQRIDQAAAAGFKAIELHWPYAVPAAKVGACCARNRLQLLGLNTATGDNSKGEFGLGVVPGRQRDFQAAIDQSIAYCKASGATSIHALAGVVPANDHDRARAVFKENLDEAVRKAAGEGLILLLEPINPRAKPSYFYSTIDEAASLIEAVGSDRIRIMFDVYHVAIAEGDVIMKLHHYKDMIGHVQVAAVPSRAEPDEGEIAYRAIFDELDAVGYSGWVGCEYRPRSSVESGLQWAEKLGVLLS
jgi:hydroxypyruvate isomerase